MDEAGIKLDPKGTCMAGSSRRSPGKKSLPLMDTFRAHAQESVKSLLAEEKSDLVFTPGGLINQLQPLDMSLTNPLKDTKVKTKWTEWMMSPDLHEHS